MKRLVLGISIMISGILLICAAVVAGGLLATTGSEFLSASSDESQRNVFIIIIGALFAVSGLILSIKEAYGKK